MTAFPLVILLIALVLIIFTVTKVKQRVGNFLAWRVGVLTSVIYLGVLLLAVPVFYLLPTKGLMSAGTIDPHVPQHNLEDLYPYAVQGTLDSQPWVYRNGSYRFKIAGNQLSLDIPENTSYFHNIIVERKETNDEELEVYTYITAYQASGIDYTKLILPPVITLEQKTLQLKADKQSFNFIRFEPEFTQFQFNDISNTTGFGWKVLYLRIPKNLEIEQGKSYVRFVN